MTDRKWKARRHWPHALDKGDILECVPFITPAQADEILRTHGSMVDGVPVISRLDLLIFLDGDMAWEGTVAEIRLNRIMEKLMKLPPDTPYPETEADWEKLRETINREESYERNTAGI